VAAAAAAEGLPAHWTTIAGHTRTCVIVLSATAARLDGEVWVDSSGPALAEAAAAAACIKINAEEAGTFLGQKIVDEDDAIAAAEALRALGPPRVAITLGGDGAICVGAEGAWRVRAPLVTIVSAVGSGDCFLGGLVSGLTQTGCVESALALAAGCGAANVQRLDVASFTAAEAWAMAARARVHRIAS
jgi:fructose-1-phosphate kinase PfkB-like protein